MKPQMRIELMTFALQKQRSNQLSYCGDRKINPNIPNRPELGIEPRISCTQSKNHATRPFWLCIIRESNPGQLVGNQLC